MSLASKISAAQDALVALLAATAGLEECHPVYAFPVPMPEKTVFVDEEVKADRDTPYSAGLGVVPGQDETFTLSVFFHTHRTALTALQLREIADTYEAIITDAIASDPTLGGVVAFAAVSGTDRAAGRWDEQGKQRFADREINVRCTAYLG